ncbi:GNAT family N-acetyltransferase [Saccharothrix variisporea]|uniref:Acetyltransferase (GNAT) family protein n=1 Tax=Saccharothrix variisporea TaxID=543527 RepID=A0A495X3F2_9PSEU|nr:GNAT family N-acetyltransferase [Saccharothrix variisporea]RKT67133.1 acetyltransferase (GNAT) family protein [Saccharothrix variisporea]
MERARQWVRGWAWCRDTPDPVEEHDGFRIDVGLSGHRVRYVITGTASVRERSSLTVPGTWLKVCAPREEVLPLLGVGWVVGEPEYLMSVPLGGVGACSVGVVGARSVGVVGPCSVAEVPDGYRVEVVGERGFHEVVVTGVGGAPAARGRFAVREGAAVVDQVVTEPEHRRRGLGKLVMGLVGELAAERGARVGVLVSTVAGRPLYESLGWRVDSDVVAAHVPGCEV